MSILLSSTVGRCTSSFPIVSALSWSRTVNDGSRRSHQFIVARAISSIQGQIHIVGINLFNFHSHRSDWCPHSSKSYKLFGCTFYHEFSTSESIASKTGKSSRSTKGESDFKVHEIDDLSIACKQTFDGSKHQRRLQKVDHVDPDFYLDDDNLLTVCILGPPNAGKSTLFNRLTCKESNRSYRLNVDKGGRKGTLKSRLSGPNNKGRTVSRLLPSLSSSFFGRRNGDTGKATGKNTSGINTGGAAIVSPLPGTTRDTRECIGRIGSVKFRLYDTAGIDRYYRSPKRTLGGKKSSQTTAAPTNPEENYTDKKWMMEQTIQAAQASDLVVLLFDARNTIGTTPEVLETARWLRKAVVGTSAGAVDDRVNISQMFPRSQTVFTDIIVAPPKKRIVVCGNKLEGTGIMPNQWEDTLFDVAKKLGFGEVIPLSALHGDVGITELGTIIDEMTMEKREVINSWQRVEKNTESTNGLTGLTAIENSAVSKFTEDWYQDMDNYIATSPEVNKIGRLKTALPKKAQEKPLQIAILGRPNVGKSTLVNKLVQCDRVLTGPTPGLTRDAIMIPFLWEGCRPVQIVDTAGIRKLKSRRTDVHTRTNDFALSSHKHQKPTDSDVVQQLNINLNSGFKRIALTTSNSVEEIEHLAGIEEMAVADAIRALKVADVAVLVLDAQAGSLHKHELAICNAILQEGRALIIAANKMDLLLRRRGVQLLAAPRNEKISYFDNAYYNNTDNDAVEYTANDYKNEVRRELEERFPILRKTPIVPMSSLTGEGVQELLPAVFRARDRWERKISTGRLNQWLQEAVLSRHAPPPVITSGNKHRTVRIKYIIQTKGRPPTFLLFCSGVGSSSTGGSKINKSGNQKPASLPESYVRYLIRNFQDAFDMYGMEVRFAVKNSNTKGNPYERINPKSALSSTVKGYGIGGREGRRKRMIRSLKASGAPSSRLRTLNKQRRTQRIKVNRYR